MRVAVSVEMRKRQRRGEEGENLKGEKERR